MFGFSAEADSRSCFQAQFPQSTSGFVQRFVALAESKAYLLCAIPRIIVEAGSRHRGHANLLHQITREGNIVREAESFNVGHHVIRSPRRKAPESSFE